MLSVREINTVKPAFQFILIISVLRVQNNVSKNAFISQYLHDIITTCLKSQVLVHDYKVYIRPFNQFLKVCPVFLMYKNWVERKEDTENGEYPYPVLYRATESILSIAILIKTVHYNADNIERDLKENKDPLQILERLHKLNLYYFTLLLETIQEDKCMPQKHIDAMANLTIYDPYKIYVSNLIAAFAKNVRFGAQFDINQLRQKHGVFDGNPDIKNRN